MSDSIRGLEGLQHFIRYNHWANNEVLASFRGADRIPPRPLQLMGHIIGAEFVWLTRIKNEKSPLAVWPELSLGECDQAVSDLFNLWSQYLGELTPERIVDSIHYKNSKGEPWSSSIQDIVMHVAFHSAYHRGQIAAEMRAAGFTPAYTDYIHGVRTGSIE
jgi:uncharacterized damage-inducible protein DinB